MEDRKKYIDFIVEQYINTYSNTTECVLRNILEKYPTDDLYRVANAIDRFGVENMITMFNRRKYQYNFRSGNYENDCSK